MPWGAASYYCAGYAVNYGEGRAALGLYPVDGEADSFATAKGSVENWVMLPYGIGDRDGIQENPQYLNNYFGGGIVLDATFRSRDLRRRARALAERHGRPFRFVEAVCDDATLRARLRARAAGVSVSDATEDLLDRFRREFEPVVELPPGEHVAVRTTVPLASQVEAIRNTLRR